MRAPVCGPGSDEGGAGADDCPRGPGVEQNEPNQPVEGYGSSVLVGLQGAVDAARKISHTIGARPYRMFMVWQQRNREREFEQVRCLELLPVKVRALDVVDLELSQAGIAPDGAILIREVSPAQVTEDDLRGFLDGELWGHDNPDREFFYELVLSERCEDPSRLVPSGTKRRRFALGTEPFLDASRLQWRFGLVDQRIARTRDGVDQTVSPDGGVVPQLPRLLP